VRFVIGPAGSGKTSRCAKRIVDELLAAPLGKPIFWILPKQETFAAQRQLACTSGLPGFTRVHAVSFDLLARQILADCGGAAIPEVTSYGRQMILGLILRQKQNDLEFFKSVARQPGLAARLDATFNELERSGKGVSDLKQLLDDLEADQTRQSDDSLLGKTRDLHRVYDAYCQYIGQERVDPHRRFQYVLSCIERCSLLRDPLVLVDGFLDFTHNERLLLTGIAKVCRDMEITILGDPSDPIFKDPHRMPDESALFYRTHSAYRKLHFTLTSENIALDPPVLLTRSYRGHVEPAMRSVNDAVRMADPAQIEFWEAGDLRSEADRAAARIRSLVASGLRYRDVVVLTRDAEEYAELIDASFREHGIPFFIDRRRSAGHHPLLQFIRAALAIAQNGFGHESIMTLVKSGLAGLSNDEADELENYVLLHRIRGTAWTKSEPWRLLRNKPIDEDEPAPHATVPVTADRADELRRRVVDRLAPFIKKLQSNQALTVRQTIIDLFAMLRAFDVQATILNWMQTATAQKQLEQRGEHEQVWNELADLFDEMAELVGDEQVTISDFVDILESGLETFDLALTPPTVDQVLVGQIDRTRSPGAQVAIVLGLSEGRFPRTAREDSILSDSDRTQFRKRSIDIENDSQRRLFDENLLAYLAFTRAYNKLIVMRPTLNDAGRPLGASTFWRELREIAGTQIEIQTPGPGDIQTPRQLVTRLMAWVRSANPGTTEPPLYQWLATHACCDDAIDIMRFRAWKALSYDNAPSLSPDVRSRLWNQPLTASVSQLESFAACPFKHFIRYGLALEERDDQDPTAIDLGNIYHETLDKLIRAILKQKLSFKDLSESRAKDLIDQCAAEVGQKVRDELMISNARNRYLLDRIKQTIEQVVAAQKAVAQRSAFVPAFTELVFNNDGAPLPALIVPTPKGHELRVHGKIDRVDLSEKDGAFAVIDYKIGSRLLSLEQVYHGLSLQLLTYLLVIQAHGEQLRGKSLAPAAALYMKLLRELEPVEHPSHGVDPSEPSFVLRTKPRGIVDGAFTKSFDNTLVAGQSSDVIQLKLKKDGTPDARSDVAPSQQIWSLLGYVEQKLGELADRILEGQIDIRPYKLRQSTPCPNCTYRDVCRFELGLNRYLHVQSLKKEDVLELLSQQEASSDGR